MAEFFDRFDRFHRGAEESLDDAFARLSAQRRWGAKLERKQRKLFEQAVQAEEEQEDALDDDAQAAATPAAFFAQFVNFTPRAHENVAVSFRRLAEARRWTQARKAHFDALFRESVGAVIEALAGGDKLGSLQQLVEEYELAAADVNVSTLSLSECRTLLGHLHVNIYDYVSGDFQRFPNAYALAKYTIKNKLIFPLEEAKLNDAWKILLRPIFFGRR